MRCVGVYIFTKRNLQVSQYLTEPDMSHSESFSSEPDNNKATEQHRCPNPGCYLIFPSIDDVCAHLSGPGFACAEWMQEFIHNLQHQEDIEDECEDGEELFYISKS